MAPPGWPDFAFSTIDAANILILSAALFNVLISVIVLYKILDSKFTL